MPRRDGSMTSREKLRNCALWSRSISFGGFTATDAAVAELSAQRARAPGAVRDRHAGLGRHSGQAARRIPQGRLDAGTRHQSLALFLRAARAAADRRRARARQCRAAVAQHADADLGVDLPRPAADDGTGLHQGDQRPGRRQRSQGSAEDRKCVSDQGRQGPGEHPRIAPTAPSSPAPSLRNTLPRAPPSTMS
jgi:hypothetical protein